MNNQTLRSLPLLFGSIALPLIIGALGSFFTVASLSDWYSTLAKPWFNPPNWVFGPVWTVLYILMGISLWLIIRNGIRDSDVRLGTLFFGLQLLVNLLWSLIFFGMRSPAGGLVTILVLLVFIILTIRAFKIVSPYAAYLLIPYLFWTVFATLLNAMLVILNLPGS
ncbi:MAG TPA: TspO/MBR family protein [Methanospirillum sp.]|nr:TspO/MBR family protein [Methanospirillum sp.]